ncbi:class I SAM-dependent methyltransferase [Candidatus Sumerlaeota bacterium]|nr:class I SAM-dependent methyltransferase [Candidatus Sumerlaeota bacterium]
MNQTDLQRRVIELWDHYTPISERFTPYPETFHLRGTEFMLLTLKLRALFPELHWKRVLDAGCGIGFGSLLWTLVADEVVGIDGAHEIKKAKRLVAERPDLTPRVSFVEGVCEDLSPVEGQFDLIVTQYALEHFRDLDASLRQIHSRLAPGGHAIHIVPNVVNRNVWFIEYRASLRWWNRFRHSVRHRGWWMTLKDPVGYTPPHDPHRGDFASEHAGYRLEKWSEAILRNGAEIRDYFPTRDLNWVLVTRPLT